MKQEKITCAGYTRVSSLHQVKEGESLGDQKLTIQKYCQAHDFKLHKIYEDAGVSGIRTDRPALEEMKKDVDKFNRLIFTCLDRFGRSTQDVLNNYSFFESKGIQLISLREGIDTSTPVGRLLRNILASLAEMERERIRERITTGLTSRAQKGGKIGEPPLGYRWDEEKKCFEINKEDAKTYKLIVDLFLTKNYSTYQVAKYLKTKSIKGRKGKDLIQSSVAGILKNPAYLGAYHFKYQGQDYNIEIPPLLTKNQYDAILKKFEENWVRPRNYNPNHPYILQDYLRCGECGYSVIPMRSGTHPKYGEKIRYYQCYLTKPGRQTDKTCHLPYIPAQEIEDYIKGKIVQLFFSPQTLINRWKETTTPENKNALESKLKGYQIKIGKLESKRKEFWEMFTDDTFDQDFLRQQDNQLRQTINNLKNEIKEVESELAFIENKTRDLKNLEVIAEDLSKSKDILNRVFKDLGNQQWGELIGETLAGNKLEVSILRVRDVADFEKGLKPKELNEPVYRESKGRKIPNWKVEGEYYFNLTKIATFLKPHFKLNNSNWLFRSR